MKSASEINNRRDTRTIIRATLLALLFAATLFLFWNGVGANDADKYARYALRLLDGEPWLGRNHWSLRLLLVAPIAASFAAFGVSEFASTIPNILCAAGLVAVTFLFARRHLGSTAAMAAAALVASSSFLVVAQSEVTIIGPEILAGVTACWLFHAATVGAMSGRTIGAAGLRRLAAAGFFAGLAFYCRETAIYLPVTFGLYLLIRRQLRRDAIAALAAGFAVVAGGELLVYAALTGDPFYRLAIDVAHRGGEGFYGLPDGAPENALLARLLLPLSYLLTAPAITPFLIIAMAIVALPRFRRRLFAGDQRRVIGLFMVAAAGNFILSAYGANLKEPDYYPMLAYATLLVIGVLIGGLVDGGAVRSGAALLAGMILLNWATADFRRYDEHAEARRLADHISETGQAVITDPKTAARTRLMLRFRGADRPTSERLAISLKTAPRPLCGLIYSATPTKADRAITPDPAWTLVWSQEVRKTRWTIAALRAVAPSVALSPRGRSVLRIADPVALYDAGPCAQQ